MFRFLAQRNVLPWAIGVLSAVFSVGASLQDASPPEVPLVPLSSVHADANTDYVPDRLGDTLRIAGRATVATGTFDDERLFVFVQNPADSTGLKLFAPTLSGPAINRGDSVVARGVVDQYQGATQLRVLDYQIAERGSPVPSPITLTVGQTNQERHEGLLARVEGQIINKNTNQGGKYLLINDPGGSDEDLMVFASNYTLRRFNFDAYEIGDRIEVTGVLTQYDYEPPRDDYYEILPRTSADIHAVGLTRSFLRRAATIGGIVLLFSVIAALLFRRQVKQRTKELAESEARFRHLAEATSEGIVFHTDGRILDINEALTQLTGYERDELIDRQVTSLLDEPSQEKLRSIFNSQTETTFEVAVVRKDGSTFPAAFQVRNLPYEGTDARVIAVRDITHRKRHEAEILAAKEEAEAVARLKSSLLNNMSHELRTPITSIVGYAELILNNPSQSHVEHARLIKQGGERLSETLNSVLEMAQIESGSLEPTLEETDVEDLAREVISLYRASATEKSVTVSVEVNTETPTLQTDRRLVYRILSNLISNAVKFTDEGRVTIRIDAVDDGLQLDVEDTGIGIDEDFLPNLFDAFKQESQGLSRDYEGTGLGLTITSRMVDLLGGTITVESTKGEGSTFTVMLPDGGAPEVADESAAPDTSSATLPTPS